jgi:hypothetical protein
MTTGSAIAVTLSVRELELTAACVSDERGRMVQQVSVIGKP